MHHRLTWNWLKQHPLVQDTSVWAGLVLVIVQSLSHVQLFATPWAAAQKLSVLHLLELAQTHVHRLGDAIQPSHPLSSPSPPAFNLSQHQGLFYWADSSHQVALVLELRVQHQSFQWIFRIDFLLLCTAEQGWFFPAQHGADSGVHSPGELSFNWNIQMALMSALDTWHWPWLGSQADCTIMIDLAQDRALPGSWRPRPGIALVTPLHSSKHCQSTLKETRKRLHTLDGHMHTDVCCCVPDPNEDPENRTL